MKVEVAVLGSPTLIVHMVSRVCVQVCVHACVRASICACVLVHALQQVYIDKILHFINTLIN